MNSAVAAAGRRPRDFDTASEVLAVPSTTTPRPGTVRRSWIDLFDEGGSAARDNEGTATLGSRSLTQVLDELRSHA